MSDQPHERHEFANATEFTVKVTYVVAGGKRAGTAGRRARRIAPRAAATLARAAGIVDVSAVAGPSYQGEILWASPVRFERANSGTQGPDGLLDRYLDPDHERALRSLAAARTRERERSQADLRRRRTVGCRVPAASGRDERPGQGCRCVYCRPEVHERRSRAARAGEARPLAPPLCPCGRVAADVDGRCASHRAVDLVVLDGDADVLRRLAERDRKGPPDSSPLSSASDTDAGHGRG